MGGGKGNKKCISPKTVAGMPAYLQPQQQTERQPKDAKKIKMEGMMATTPEQTEPLTVQKVYRKVLNRQVHKIENNFSKKLELLLSPVKT